MSEIVKKNGSTFAAVIIKVNFGASVLNEGTNRSCIYSFLTPKLLLLVFTYWKSLVALKLIILTNLPLGVFRSFFFSILTHKHGVPWMPRGPAVKPFLALDS